MSAPELPEYYRHLANMPAEESSSQPASKQSDPGGRSSRPAPAGPSSSAERADKVDDLPGESWRYDAHDFNLSVPKGWNDITVFTLTGTVTDDIRHGITITRQEDLNAEDVVEFAALQVQSLEDSLKGCRLLLTGTVTMDDGREAYRAIFVWWPTEELRLYQEQLYVLHEGTGYTLTASFTKKTRKTLGPQIERAMRSFSPANDR